MSLKVLIAPVAVFCFIYFVVPFSLDIPDIINDNFQQVSGTVLTKAYSSRDSERLIRIADDKSGVVVKHVKKKAAKKN